MTQVQIAGFKWKKDSLIAAPSNSGGFNLTNLWKPLLLLSNGQDGDLPSRLSIWDSAISIKLGNKSCNGYFSAGSHYKCPDSAAVEWESTCKSCRSRDDWFGCIQCAGETDKEGKIICNNRKQRAGCEDNNYWLYLTAFNGQLKVGVSYEHRFFERMIEQGADFGCRLGMVQDGGLARGLEQRIARYLGLPDKIDGATKQANLIGEPNKSVVNIAKAVAQLSDAGFFEVKPEVYDFRRHYRLERIAMRPRPVKITPGVRLVGDIIATKGNIIVMQSAAGTISFDARRLVGYQAEISYRQTNTIATLPSGGLAPKAAQPNNI